MAQAHLNDAGNISPHLQIAAMCETSGAMKSFVADACNTNLVEELDGITLRVKL